MLTIRLIRSFGIYFTLVTDELEYRTFKNLLLDVADFEITVQQLMDLALAKLKETPSLKIYHNVMFGKKFIDHLCINLFRFNENIHETTRSKGICRLCLL